MESVQEGGTATPVVANTPPRRTWFWVFILVVLSSLLVFGQFAFAALLTGPSGGCGGG